MNAMDPQRDPLPWATAPQQGEEPGIALVDLLTWIGEGKKLIATVTVTIALASVGISLLLPDAYTARSTMLPPSSQQQGGAGAAFRGARWP